MAVALYRTLALTLAKTQVGTKEEPAGSNRGPQVDKYESVTGAVGEPWCASFVQWCFKTVGMPQPFLSKSAYVPYILSEAKKLGWLVSVPAAGDLVCFDWEHDGVADHIGFVRTKVDKFGNFTTVEGNTADGNNSNGGEVMVRTRNVSEVAGFIRVPGGKTVAKPRPRPVPDPAPQPEKKTPYDGMLPMWAWFKWKDDGKPGKRPAQVKLPIPASWWVRYALHRRGK